MSGFEITLYLLLLSCVNLAQVAGTYRPAQKPIPTGVRDVNTVGYDLSNPDRIFNLPPALLEISGITVIDSTSVACVQDENGMVFIFDLVKNEIRDHFIFHYAGDYEGIAKVAGSYYILRSDGTLFETGNQASSEYTQQILSAGGPPANYEGLCYDNLNHRLLIVPKGHPGHEYGDEKKHPVYGFDLRSGKYSGEPVVELDLTAVTSYAAENNIEVPDDKSKISLTVSDIGIHPMTKMLYVISAVNRMLFVFDEDGNINYIEKLDPDMFNMPEGISFHDNGDMLISNEGRTNPPTILLFKYTPK
ncbi:MAG: hypothetical protein U5L72_04815 [Bacteroidales bacterium]|nr:hypothetical protein [Bacteroidales bacterium]